MCKNKIRTTRDANYKLIISLWIYLTITNNEANTNPFGIESLIYVIIYTVI